MEIPGYYLDPVKKKYFKIQKNHIAPPNTAYSVDAVNEQKLKAHAGQIEQQQRFQKRAQRLKHDRRLHHPLTSLQHRLGDNRPGNVTTIVAEHYGASIRPSFILPQTRVSSHFAFGGMDQKTLVICTTDVSRGHYGPQALIALRREEGDLGRYSWTTGTRDDIVPTNGRIASLTLTPRGTMAWTEDRGPTIDTNVHVAQLNPDYETTSHSIYTLRNEQKMQLAASPEGAYWVGWTSSTISVERSNYDHGVSKMLTSSNQYEKDSLLTVAFQNEWILMAGHRSGFVNFLDHRDSSQTQVRRLRHNSPVNALKMLKDGNTVLANGMGSTALYDLRYVAKPRTSKKSEPCSTPLLSFTTSRASDRLELGLDYCPDLNLVAMASSRNQCHCVTLYSTRTGRVVPSALDETSFDGAIPCLKFAYSLVNPPSLLMVPESEDPRLLEWACDI